MATITPTTATSGSLQVATGHLNADESKKVIMTIAPECLAIWNREMKRLVEPGKFKVLVGASSQDIRLNGEFEIAP